MNNVHRLRDICSMIGDDVLLHHTYSAAMSVVIRRYPIKGVNMNYGSYASNLRALRCLAGHRHLDVVRQLLRLLLSSDQFKQLQISLNLDRPMRSASKRGSTIHNVIDFESPIYFSFASLSATRLTTYTFRSSRTGKIYLLAKTLKECLAYSKPAISSPISASFSRWQQLLPRLHQDPSTVSG